MPGERKSVLEDAVAAAPIAAGDLNDVLSAWAVQARWTLSPDNATPSVPDIRAVTVDLALLSAHSARVLVTEARQREVDSDRIDQLRRDLNATALGWRDIHQAWPERVFGPAPGTRRQAEASRALHRTLDAITRPDGTWLEGSELLERAPDLTVVASALRQGTLTSHHLATTYQGMPDSHVEAGRLFAQPAP